MLYCLNIYFVLWKVLAAVGQIEDNTVVRVELDRPQVNSISTRTPVPSCMYPIMINEMKFQGHPEIK